MFIINFFDDDWIQTEVLWNWKQLLYQLSHLNNSIEKNVLLW